MALTRIADLDAILRYANDASRSVRMGVLLALRRLQREEIVRFLDDKDDGLVLEAAVINDEPINGGMKELAGLIERPAHSEPLLRRVLNANFHYGTRDTAKALASFAAKADMADNMRVEALEELGEWAHPDGKDRVVGLWRPVAGTRSDKTAADALAPILSTLLRSAPNQVRIAALQTAGDLSLTNAGAEAFDLATIRTNSVRLRVAALRALPRLDQSRFEEAMKTAENDESEDVRKAAMRLQSQVRNSKPVTRLASVLEKEHQVKSRLPSPAWRP